MSYNLEALWEVEVQLDGWTLPSPANRIPNFDIYLRTCTSPAVQVFGPNVLKLFSFAELSWKEMLPNEIWPASEASAEKDLTFQVNLRRFLFGPVHSIQSNANVCRAQLLTPVSAKPLHILALWYPGKEKMPHARSFGDDQPETLQ